jgi:hypothetical protein
VYDVDEDSPVTDIGLAEAEAVIQPGDDIA